VQLETEDLKAVRVHHSRVLRFIGRELPRAETVRENYWGASELEHIWDELQKRSAASANIAQLIFQANVTVLKMGNFGSNLAAGSERMKEMLFQSIMNENRLKTSYGVQVMSADDSMETHSYSFAGLSDIYESFMMDMAGAAEIPATKLFGRSPQGFNSTGESDLRNYYDMIAQMQERLLRPALEKLLPVMAISCWGYVPEDLEIVFEPVMTSSPAERAELVQKMSSDLIQAFQAGLLTREEALEELKSRGEELGVYTKINSHPGTAFGQISHPGTVLG
jgi:phage-related protein (TIGR01555 family)